MMMTFTQAVSSALSSYATFHGRARRSEYWWFHLFTILVAIPAGVIDAILNMAFNNEIGIVGTITSLALLLPSLAVTARRLHDTGRSGWWMLLPVAPLLAAFVVGIATVVSALLSAGGDGAPRSGLIVLLVFFGLLTLAAVIIVTVFLCLRSDPGPNKYGPPPGPPMLSPGTGGYYPPAGYGQPYGHPQQLPSPGSSRPQW